MPPATQSRSRWLRVSLRGLMVLVLVIGGGLGWLVHRARVQRDAVVAITRTGGSVRYQIIDDYGGDILLRDQPRPLSGWLIGWLGDDYSENVRVVFLGPEATDVDLAQAGRFSMLKLLKVGQANVSEAALARLILVHPDLVISR